MKEQMEQRLQQLRNEYETGQKMLADLEAKQLSLRETLLRIDGAIQVLEEVLEAETMPVENGKSVSESEAVEIEDFNSV